VHLTVSGAASALADRAKLRQAVFNLVKNAVEAAGFDGRVEVRVGETSGGPHIRVSDTGPGIPPELRRRLFEPLFTTKESGTGLGLAVSRAIARAHGGELAAEAPPGGGARFTLRLPTAAREAPSLGATG
jgi:signal transduction histidine kinase